MEENLHENGAEQFYIILYFFSHCPKAQAWSPWCYPCQHLRFQVFENDLKDQAFSVLPRSRLVMGESYIF